jgi:hypothetical protein
VRALALLLLVAACTENPAECGFNQAAVIVITLHDVSQSLSLGHVDQTVNCPVHGTAHITGTISSHGLLGPTDYNLQFMLTDCLDDSLTLDGTIAETSSAGLLRETDNVSSNALLIRGNCIGCDHAIDATCSMSYSSANRGTGHVCDKAFP